MLTIEWRVLRDRVNSDAEWQIAARHWSARLRLDLGDESRCLRVADGRVEAVDQCAPEADCDLFVTASESVWTEMLAPTPRPYYQDLYGAQAHHGVRLPEDPISYAAYYPALRRLVQIMADVHGGA